MKGRYEPSGVGKAVAALLVGKYPRSGTGRLQTKVTDFNPQSSVSRLVTEGLVVVHKGAGPWVYTLKPGVLEFVRTVSPWVVVAFMRNLTHPKIKDQVFPLMAKWVELYKGRKLRNEPRSFLQFYGDRQLHRAMVVSLKDLIEVQDPWGANLYEGEEKRSRPTRNVIDNAPGPDPERGVVIDDPNPDPQPPVDDGYVEPNPLGPVKILPGDVFPLTTPLYKLLRAALTATAMLTRDPNKIDGLMLAYFTGRPRELFIAASAGASQAHIRELFDLYDATLAKKD